MQNRLPTAASRFIFHKNQLAKHETPAYRLTELQQLQLHEGRVLVNRTAVIPWFWRQLRRAAKSHHPRAKRLHAMHKSQGRLPRTRPCAWRLFIPQSRHTSRAGISTLLQGLAALGLRGTAALAVPGQEWTVRMLSAAVDGCRMSLSREKEA